MLALAFDRFHAMWQLSYTGARWREFLAECIPNCVTYHMFWQGSDSSHHMQYQSPDSWEMFEFWMKDEDAILEFALEVAAHMDETLVI